MTTPPNFDDLIGVDLTGPERERLLAVHEQLLTAGPPPELPPQLESGPTLAMTLGRTGSAKVTRRVALHAAPLCILGVAFLFG